MSYVLGNAKIPGTYLNFLGLDLLGTWRPDEATVWPTRQAAEDRRNWVTNIHTDVVVVQVCETCQMPMDAGTPGCEAHWIKYNNGIILGVVSHDGKARCSNCHVKPGEPHHSICALEKCPNCGGLIISCDCGKIQP